MNTHFWEKMLFDVHSQLKFDISAIVDCHQTLPSTAPRSKHTVADRETYIVEFLRFYIVIVIRDSVFKSWQDAISASFTLFANYFRIRILWIPVDFFTNASYFFRMAFHHEHTLLSTNSQLFRLSCTSLIYVNNFLYFYRTFSSYYKLLNLCTNLSPFPFHSLNNVGIPYIRIYFIYLLLNLYSSIYSTFPPKSIWDIVFSSKYSMMIVLVSI